MKLLRLGGGFTDDAPFSSSGGARNEFFGWPQGEIMTHIVVAISRYLK